MNIKQLEIPAVAYYLFVTMMFVVLLTIGIYLNMKCSEMKMGETHMFKLSQAASIAILKIWILYALISTANILEYLSYFGFVAYFMLGNWTFYLIINFASACLSDPRRDLAKGWFFISFIVMLVYLIAMINYGYPLL